MATTVSTLLEQGKQAAANLRQAREHANNLDGTEAEMDQAWHQVDLAEQSFNAINGQLYAHTGQTINITGQLVSGWSGEAQVNGDLMWNLSEEAEARLLLGGAEETAEMDPAEVIERAAEVRHYGKPIDQVLEEATGLPPDQIPLDQAARILREAELELFGWRDRPIIGHDPTQVSDEDREDDIAAESARRGAAELLGKETWEDLSPEEVKALKEMVEERGIIKETGVPLDLLSDVEKMQAAASIREKHQQWMKERLEEDAEDAASGTGQGGGSGQGTGGGQGAADARFPAIGGAGTADTTDTPDGETEEVASDTDTGSPGARGTTGTTDQPVSRDTQGATEGTGSTSTPVETPPAQQAPAESAAGQTSNETPSGNEAPAAAPPVSAPETGGGGGAATGAAPVVIVGQVQHEGTAYRSEDGQWFDAWGNEITDPTTLANLEGLYESWLNDGGEPNPIGTITPTGETHEDALAAASDDDSGTESGSNSTDSDEDDDGEEEDSDEGDGEGDEEEPETTDSAEAETDEGDDSEEGEGGDEGTPTPDDIGRPDAASNREFLESPLGRETMDLHREAARVGAGGGLIDVALPQDKTAWYQSDLSAQERALAGEAVEMATGGGYTDPPEHGEFRTGAGSPVDELRLAGGGAIDPVDPAPGRAPVDNPVLGAPPVNPGGGTNREVGSLQTGAVSGSWRGDGSPEDDDDFPKFDPDDPDGGFGGNTEGLGDDPVGSAQTYLLADFNLQINDDLAENINTDALDDFGD